MYSLVSKTTLATTVFCFALTTTAFFSPEFSSPSSPRPLTPQFQSWYPKHNKKLINYTLTTCNESYDDYLAAFNSPRGSRNASYLLSTCYRLEGCLLDAMPSDWQANFNSALVILALMPTLLATIGPSLAEISLLSAHRPLLSFFISMGAPAIYVPRTFEYIHPTKTLRKRQVTLPISKMHPWPAAMMSLGQYVVAIGATVNVITTSIGMGRKSILAYGCTMTFAPLLWSSLSIAIHLVSSGSYLITRKMARRRVPVEPLLKEGNSSETGGDSQQSRSERNQATTSSVGQQHSWLRNAWLRETTICANRSKSHHFHDKTPVHQAAVLLAVAAGLMSFVHVTFGIFIFSSLQFITVTDALNQILWRYIVSAVACRLVLIIEIDGLTIVNAGASGPGKASDLHNSQQ